MEYKGIVLSCQAQITCGDVQFNRLSPHLDHMTPGYSLDEQYARGLSRRTLWLHGNGMKLTMQNNPGQVTACYSATTKLNQPYFSLHIKFHYIFVL